MRRKFALKSSTWTKLINWHKDHEVFATVLALLGVVLSHAFLFIWIVLNPDEAIIDLLSIVSICTGAILLVSYWLIVYGATESNAVIRRDAKIARVSYSVIFALAYVFVTIQNASTGISFLDSSNYVGAVVYIPMSLLCLGINALSFRLVLKTLKLETGKRKIKAV